MTTEILMICHHGNSSTTPVWQIKSFRLCINTSKESNDTRLLDLLIILNTDIKHYGQYYSN
jgi:hypothetical protein